MERINRIRKFLQTNPPKAECIIISSEPDSRVILSYRGSKLVWEWGEDGLSCPGATSSIDVDPLGAEALVTEEINALLKIEDIDPEIVVYIDEEGKTIPGIILVPPLLEGNSLENILKIEMLKSLLSVYIKTGNIITEEMIDIAIGNEVLGPFLSIINSY